MKHSVPQASSRTTYDASASQIDTLNVNRYGSLRTRVGQETPKIVPEDREIQRPLWRQKNREGVVGKRAQKPMARPDQLRAAPSRPCMRLLEIPSLPAAAPRSLRTAPAGLL